MAFRIQGTPIISDSRELLGVGTGGITTALYVGENIEMDAATGIATFAGIHFGSDTQTYNNVVTDLTGTLNPEDLASAESIFAFVEASVGDAGTLDFGGNSGSGAVNIGAGETFGLVGTDNEIVTGAATTELTISLSSTLQLPGTLAFGAGNDVNEIVVALDPAATDDQLPTAKAVVDAINSGVSTDITANTVTTTDFVSVGTGLTVGGTFRFGTGTEVDEITTTVDGSSTDAQIPTALAVFTALDSGLTGDISATNVSASSSITAGDGLYVTGPSELESLAVSGLSTFTGTAEFNGLVQLDAGANLTAGQALGIQTNDGTLQSITHVGVNTGLNETGAASDNVLPTERAVKLYVDAQIQETGGSLNVAGDSGSGSIDLSSQTFTIQGTSLEVETSAADQTVTIGLPDNVTITDALTVTGDINANGNIVGDTATNISGINSVTAVEYYGDGSKLTGISTSAQILITARDTDNVEYPVPFASASTGVVDLHSDAGTPSEALRYNPSTGTLSAVNVNSLSDSRFKQNVETIEDAVGKVNQLRGVEYDWTNETGSSVGVIAQEVQEVYPQLIQDGGDRLTVNYNGLVGLLLQAVKELSAEVEALKQSK